MGPESLARVKRAERDMADLQRLIRFVERWRMAHFQSPEMSAGTRPRLSDADALLRKMRTGLVAAASQASDAMLGGQSRPAFQY